MASLLDKLKNKKSKSSKFSEGQKKIFDHGENWLSSEGQLAVDIYETDLELVVRSAIAGIDSDNLDVSIENDVLTIKGKRDNPATKDTRKNYLTKECYWGPFSREIILSKEIDPSRVRASMEKGILTIRMPKIERERKRKIIIGE